MKLLNNILYIEFAELVEAGVSEVAIKMAKQRSSDGWSFLNDPMDARRVLVAYEPLKEKYKELILEKYGNPYEHIALHSIKAHLISKPEDVEFIRDFTLANGKHLPENYQREYIRACQFLHLMARTTPTTVKQLGLDNMVTFNNAMQQLIKSEGVKLPAAYSKLREKVRQYAASGASCVVSKKWGNDNRVKLGEQQLAFIRQLRAMPNQLNTVQISELYNRTAVEKGWPTVTSQAVFWHVAKPEVKNQLVGLRLGIKEYRNANDFVIHRMRPSRPCELWVGDGTPFELYYQSREVVKGHSVVKYHNRKYVYVVIDAYNDAIMGYAIGESETIELAKLAWKNAVVSAGRLPNQVKTDRFALSALRELYEKIALNSDFFTPSAVGNARDKVIEPFFGNIFKTTARLLPNFSGHNVKAKTQINPDHIHLNKQSFPDEQGVVHQINQCMMAWNNKVRQKYGQRALSGKSLMQDWESGDFSNARLLTDELRLSLFGELHAHKNRLTNRGIQFTINGHTRTYMLLEDAFADSIGQKYQVIYDPVDLSKIMVVADEGRRRFVVPELNAVPMAFGDMKAGDRRYLNTLLTYKKKRIEYHAQKNLADRETITRLGIDAEALTKGFFVQSGGNKGLLNDAEEVLKVPEESFPVDGVSVIKRDVYDTDDFQH